MSNKFLIWISNKFKISNLNFEQISHNFYTAMISNFWTVLKICKIFWNCTTILKYHIFKNTINAFIAKTFGVQPFENTHQQNIHQQKIH